MAQATHRFRGHVHEGKPKARGNVGRDAAEIRRMALAGAAFFDVAMVQGTCLRNPFCVDQLFIAMTTALGLKALFSVSRQ